MADPWPLPWLCGHRAPCQRCKGTGIRGGLAHGDCCRACRGLGFVSKSPAQIIAEMIQEAQPARNREGNIMTKTPDLITMEHRLSGEAITIPDTQAARDQFFGTRDPRMWRERNRDGTPKPGQVMER